MANERQKATRGSNPLLAKLKASDTFIDSVMSETGLNSAVAPTDPLQAALGGALNTTVPGTFQQRKEVAFQARQEARTPAGRAAQGLLADEGFVPEGVSPETTPEAEVDPEQVKALLSEWTPAEREAIQDALLEEAGTDESYEAFRADPDFAAAFEEPNNTPSPVGNPYGQNFLSDTELAAVAEGDNE